MFIWKCNPINLETQLEVKNASMNEWMRELKMQKISQWIYMNTCVNKAESLPVL